MNKEARRFGKREGLAQIDRHDGGERWIKAEQVHAALALREVVENQHRGEPDENIFEARIEFARRARGLGADDRQQHRPRHEAGEQRELHIIEGMNVALVEIAAAREAKHVLRKDLLAKKSRATFDQRRQVPSSGKYQHDDRSANQIHFADEVPSSFGGNPYQGDETRKNQADGALGQNG